LSVTGNTCLSIQSLVHVMAFRCQAFVAQSPYATFCGLTYHLVSEYQAESVGM